jgi:hypothetical protein
MTVMICDDLTEDTEDSDDLTEDTDDSDDL